MIPTARIRSRNVAELHEQWQLVQCSGKKLKTPIDSVINDSVWIGLHQQVSFGRSERERESRLSGLQEVAPPMVVNASGQLMLMMQFNQQWPKAKAIEAPRDRGIEWRVAANACACAQVGQEFEALKRERSKKVARDLGGPLVLAAA